MTSDIIGVVRPDGDRRTVRLDRTYDTDAKDLWSALTEPDRLARWFARIEGDLRVDGTFCVFFSDEDREQRTIGQIVDCRPPQRLEVTWYFREEGESVVTIELSAEDDATRLVLEHRRLPLSSTAGYGAGWQAYLEALAADLAGDAGRGPRWDERWQQLRPAYEERVAAASG